MSKNQIDRLKKDNKELGHYIAKLHKKGKTDLAYKMSKKQDFLNQLLQILCKWLNRKVIHISSLPLTRGVSYGQLGQILCHYMTLET